MFCGKKLARYFTDASIFITLPFSFRTQGGYKIQCEYKKYGDGDQKYFDTFGTYAAFELANKKLSDYHAFNGVSATINLFITWVYS